MKSLSLRLFGREVVRVVLDETAPAVATPAPPSPGQTHAFGFGPTMRPARDYWGEVQA